MNSHLSPFVTAVSRSKRHSLSKSNELTIRLLAGLGVEGDSHMGATVKHSHHVRKQRSVPNLRQVHLLHEELFDELETSGFAIERGALGENVTTRGIDLLALPKGARLRLGPDAVIKVTGLRNPCRQVNGYQRGLMKALLARRSDGRAITKAGIMAIVIAGGDVRPGDSIAIELPVGELVPLLPV